MQRYTLANLSKVAKGTRANFVDSLDSYKFSKNVMVCILTICWLVITGILIPLNNIPFLAKVGIPVFCFFLAFWYIKGIKGDIKKLESALLKYDAQMENINKEYADFLKKMGSNN